MGQLAVFQSLRRGSTRAGSVGCCCFEGALPEAFQEGGRSLKAEEGSRDMVRGIIT